MIVLLGIWCKAAMNGVVSQSTNGSLFGMCSKLCVFESMSENACLIEFHIEQSKVGWSNLLSH